MPVGSAAPSARQAVPRQPATSAPAPANGPREAQQLAGAIGAPVLPLLCVHDTRIPWDEIYVDNVPALTPARLLALLRSLPAHMDQTGVMLLAGHARQRTRPAI